MTEPKAVATGLEKVVEGVYRWTVSDERIGGTPSTAVAVEEAPGSIVIVNPVRIEQKELDGLGHVDAILLTGPSHLRSAPHYRELTGAAIWAPAGAEFEDFEPDERFSEGNELPGGLRVIALPGPSESESAFYLKRGGGVVLIGDALTNMPSSGGLQVLSKEHNPDVSRTKQSLKKLLDLPFEAMVFAHGDPITGRARDRLRELLGKP